MQPRFSKVVALSRRPVGAPVEAPCSAIKDTVPSQGTGSHESRYLRDTVSLEDTEPTRGTVSSEGTVSSQGPVSLKLYRCFSAQDGHSFAEERLYNALWHARHARPESDDTRLIAVGWDLMSKLAGMTPRNAKENCLRLIQKLAMEKVESHRSEERIGTTYRLYSYGVILDRRRRAGLEWITRNRGGVVFVPGPQPSRGTVSPHRPQIGDTVPSQATLSVPSEDRGTVASEDTPLDNKIVNVSQASSSSPNHSVISTHAAQLGVLFDDDAVRKLIQRCRDGDPDATEDEIADFLDLTIRQLHGRRNVENWVGMLLAAVPAYFSPPRTELVRYREARAATELKSREDRDALMAEIRKTLENPDATASDLAMARQWLETS
jgi:hypothetical protein